MSLLCLSGVAAAAEGGGVFVSARYGARTALIQSFGTLFNGDTESKGGSGLLIGDSLILTNSHVVLLESNYKTWRVEVRLTSRQVDPLTVTQVIRDNQRDLALLKLAAPAAGASGTNRCPMPAVQDANLAPMGTPIFVLGFPLDLPLSLSSGLISNQGTDEKNHKSPWQTDSVMNAGNSGGPVFNEFGALIGIAQGGDVSWTTKGVSSPTNGVNFLIPVVSITDSPLFDIIKALPQPQSCWTSWATTTVNASNFSKISGPLAEVVGKTIPNIIFFNADKVSPSDRPHIQNVPTSEIPLPATINRAFTVSETKDDHPVVAAEHSATYTKTFAAEPGYRITACNWHAETANHAGDLVCNVQPGQQSAVFSFRLTSGPQFDRWRGWWGGSVNLTEAHAQ